MRHEIEKPHRRYEQSQLGLLLGRRHGYFRALAEVAAATVRLWLERRRIRRQMARDMRTFNDAMFEDAGTTRREAEREVRRPFWRPLGL